MVLQWVHRNNLMCSFYKWYAGSVNREACLHACVWGNPF